ncbi:MAG: 50S ribosomal protein L20 [Leptospirales bacterium]
MRSVNGTIHKNRRKKVLNRAKGFLGGRSKLYRTAKDAIMKSGQWAYRDRKVKKRDFRSLWIMRINAACRAEGLTYSRFIAGLTKTKIELNRKSLSEIAIHNPDGFKKLLEMVKAAI